MRLIALLPEALFILVFAALAVMVCYRDHIRPTARRPAARPSRPPTASPDVPVRKAKLRPLRP